jgi:hypothetical protein
MSSSEQIAFDMFLASVCSMQYHPGAGTKEHQKLTVRECGDVALDMLKVRREMASHLMEEK